VKLGIENKTKTLAAAVLAVLAIFMLWRTFTGSGGETPAPSSTSTAATKAPAASSTPAKRKPAVDRSKAQPLLAQTLDPTLRFDLLKSSEDVTYKGSGRDIFHSQPPPPEIPKVVTTPLQAQQQQAPPPPPPINLKLYGYAQRKNGESKRIFLSSGDDIFVAKEGDIVNRRYKILKINNNSVDVEDVLTNNRQTLYLQQG
jgi:hypothetical protein